MNSASKQMERLRATSGTAAAAVSKGTAFGVVLLVVSMLMIIIGSATNEWYKIVPNDGSPTYNFGLFHWCVYSNGITGCADFSRDSKCTDSQHNSLFATDGECAKFNTTRGLVLICIFTNGFAIAAMIAVGFLGRGSPMFGFGFSLLTAVLGLIATSIFGALKSELQSDATFVAAPAYSIELDWSFALFTTGWIVCMLSGPFIVKGSSKD